MYIMRGSRKFQVSGVGGGLFQGLDFLFALVIICYRGEGSVGVRWRGDGGEIFPGRGGVRNPLSTTLDTHMHISISRGK